MNKISQYLPFILWGISTIILTGLILLILPIILLGKERNPYVGKEAARNSTSESETIFTYAFSDACLKNQILY